MATLGNKLITNEQKWSSNMTESNHLGAALMLEPELVMGSADTLFTAQNYYSDNPMLSMLMGNSKTEKTINGNKWEWKVKGVSTRPSTIVENILPSSVTKPGSLRRPFKIKLAENWYVPGDVLSPTKLDNKYQFRVMSEVVPSGNGFIYSVIMVTKSGADFCPLSALTSNSPWSKLYSTYEEGNEQRGSTITSTPMSLANEQGKYGKKYKITDYASTDVLSVGIKDSKGDVHSSWFRYAEVEYWIEWYRELERGVWYNRAATDIDGSTGRPVRTGAAIHEQLEDSHVRRYTHLTAKLIEDYLSDIFYGRKKPGMGRKVTGYSGEFGIKLFHSAIDDWMNKNSFIKNIESFSGKSKSDLHSNSLEVGYQFTRYNMANGTSLELVHMPLYDDPSINSAIDPVTGYPIESQRITFLDFDGGKSKDSNIKLTKRRDSEAFSYIEGMFGPYGPKKRGSNASHAGSYYEMHVEKVCNVHIHDVTKCGELILDRAS